MNDMASTATESPITGPVRRLRSEIDRLFDEFAWPTRNLLGFGTDMPGLDGPLLDFKDLGDRYRLTAEMPGMDESDVELTVTDRTLTLSGEKKEHCDHQEGSYLLQERRYGAIRREIPLPDDADPDAIEAHFKNGVLTVKLQKDKNSPARTRRIEVGKA